jgi:3-hydroxyisobutyrate dehydrogenase-like beta-hydroxyacid dehydrogenase
MTKVAFLGLGVMGYPMAGHLVAAGHDVSVWNRTASVTERWGSEYDGSTHGSVADAVSGADLVMMCVGQDADVLDVASRAVPAMKTGAILVDHTTASDGCAKQVGKLCAEAGLRFIDAPISGGEAGAINGQLTVMCGGDQTHFDAAKPVIDAYAKAVKLMGPVGAGQLTKMVNQICIAGMLQGLSEAVNFAQAAGLDMDEVVGAIGKGAAQSWQMDNRASTMAKGEYEFGFAVDWMRKDLGIVLDAAKALDLDMPVTELVDSYYAEVQSMGGNRWDTSSLLARLKSKA